MAAKCEGENFHRLSPQCGAYHRELLDDKSVSLIFPGDRGPSLQIIGALCMHANSEGSEKTEPKTDIKTHHFNYRIHSIY